MLISDIALNQKDEQISILIERIELLEDIITNFEQIDALTNDVREKNITLASYDQEWISWVSQNMWIVEVDWGE